MANLSLLRLAKLLGARLWASLFFPINWELPASPVLLLLLAAASVALLYSGWASRHSPLAWFSLCAAVFCALPASSQLLIGAGLQKSRLLYLPSVGLALLLGVACASLTSRRAGLACAAAIIAFHAGALRHNLVGWQHVSTLSRVTCDSARQFARSPERQVVAIGLPGSIRGVYFFMNGLDACLGLGDGGYWQVQSLPPGAQPPPGFQGDVLRWQESTSSLAAVRP